MSEYVAKVTSKGQLTLPAAVRRSLGINLGDRVTIVIEDDRSASMRRLDHTVASVRESIATPPELDTDDFDDLIDEAMSDLADGYVRRMRENAS